MSDSDIKSYSIPSIVAETPTITIKHRSPIIRGLGVTVAENRFSDLIVSKMATAVDAYMQTHNCIGLTEGAVGQRAHKLLKKGRVSRHIDVLRKQMLEKSIHSKDYAKHWVLGKLEKIVEESDKDRTTALRLIMQHYGMISESSQVIVEDKRSADELGQELERRLAAIMPTKLRAVK